MKVYVYLYEDGKKRSFEDLSGQELESLEHHLKDYGTLNADTGEEYAVIEEFEGTKKNLKKFVITPRQYGESPWGEVKVEFRTTVRPPRKTRSKTKKTGGNRKKTRRNR